MAKTTKSDVEAISNGNSDAGPDKKARVSQSEVPSCSLEEALRIPTAIAENYASKPTRPLDVAAAISLTPTSGSFRMLCGAALAYGLTDGGYNAAHISVSPLARQILRPPAAGQAMNARREAILKPRMLREFLSKYDGHKLPREEIATNVLERMGVPGTSVKRTFHLILESAKSVGMLQEIKGGLYVNLNGPASSEGLGDAGGDTYEEYELPDGPSPVAGTPGLPTSAPAPAAGESRSGNRRVFITHGKNKDFLDPLKDLLSFGELEAVVSVDRESVSLPVPDKVMNDMRSCSAAIIHVDAEQKLIDQNGDTHVVLNPNVLIEIGAAMALYGRRFILLVKDGVTLPSNLQGLYEVRYQGDKLDGDATIRLLKAIRDIKNHPLPNLTG